MYLSTGFNKLIGHITPVEIKPTTSDINGEHSVYLARLL